MGAPLERYELPMILDGKYRQIKNKQTDALAIFLSAKKDHLHHGIINYYQQTIHCKERKVTHDAAFLLLEII